MNPLTVSVPGLHVSLMLVIPSLLSLEWQLHDHAERGKGSSMQSTVGVKKVLAIELFIVPLGEVSPSERRSKGCRPCCGIANEVNIGATYLPF